MHLNFLFFNLFTFVETLYFKWFGTNFSASSIFILFETNTAEASEFIKFYINSFSVSYAVIMVLYLVIYKIKHQKKKVITAHSVNRTQLIIGLILCLFFLRITKLIDQNYPYLVLRGSIEYFSEREKLKQIHIHLNEGHFTNVSLEEENPKTIVLVIGESSTRNNFELYNYPRKNNPKLSKRKEELYLFNDVISSSAYTIGALKTALTLNNFEHKNESSIIQLFNQAGFETHWISNQRPIGPYESIVTKISKASNFQTYTNSETAGQKTPLDEVLLPHLKTALKRKANNKFIVLHLLGTHLKYSDRYPDNFNIFKDTPPNFKFSENEAIKKRNEYDNAILYNDFIINQVISLLEKEKKESLMLYFSDHGDEVFHEKDFAGHNEDNTTASMHEIPFILWKNQLYQKNFKGVIDEQRPYSTQNLIHSLAQLAKIKFDEFESEKSIFSENFHAKDRFTTNGKNYDKIFKN
ncbi:MAG: sulfatase-like hydrolase/transferase [Flavobacteriaceae bacterium]|nr:sulfatase-like hydrolase/transferase [Flavobacteriaceae bacterium]